MAGRPQRGHRSGRLRSPFSRAFGNSPYVGIQFDPSHYIRQFMDPYQAARDWVDKIYDVHLKDTEIKYQVLPAHGDQSPAPAQWFRYRIPGQGQIDWPKSSRSLQDKGYAGAMNIEHEDDTYRPGYTGMKSTMDIKRVSAWVCVPAAVVPV